MSESESAGLTAPVMPPVRQEFTWTLPLLPDNQKEARRILVLVYDKDLVRRETLRQGLSWPTFCGASSRYSPCQTLVPRCHRIITISFVCDFAFSDSCESGQ